MKVRVLPTMCMSHRLCERIAPKVFKVDQFGFSWAIIEEDLPKELHTGAREAVYRCPAKALLVDDG